jgi:hypothetical protein
MRRLRLPFIVAAAVLASTSIASEPIGQATLNAVAYEPMPAETAIEVQVQDDSDENLAVRAQLLAELESRGFTVTVGAPLLLSIETGDSVGAWRSPGRTDRIRMMDDRGRLFPQGELDVTRQLQVPLPRTTIVTPAQYRIGLTLDQRKTGVRIWEGWTIADLSQGEPSALAQGMVTKLADTIGQTVREQPFELQ